MLELTVNGEKHTLEIDSGTPLLAACDPPEYPEGSYGSTSGDFIMDVGCAERSEAQR